MYLYIYPFIHVDPDFFSIYSTPSGHFTAPWENSGAGQGPHGGVPQTLRRSGERPGEAAEIHGWNDEILGKSYGKMVESYGKLWKSYGNGLV